MNMPCEIQTTTAENCFIMHISGDVTADVRTQLLDAHKTFRETGLSIVIYDFEELKYINSSGLALLLEIVTDNENSSVEYRCFGLTSHFQKIARMVGMDSYMKIFDSRGDAVAS